jgi:hypothetical protein
MASNVMDGAGFYNEHSVQQEEAAAAGVAMLQRAVGEVPLPDGGPFMVADYGSSEGKNSFHPLRVALDQLGTRDGTRDLPVSVVHTDLPENDFTSLFETVEHDPETYARPGVFTYAAGRSFYEPLFPDGTVSLGWSATAVVWLRATPCPLPDHLFSFAATGARRKTWAEAATKDWETFLRLRAAELRSGGEVVVTTLVSGPNYLDWMAVVEGGVKDALDAGVIRPSEYEAMVIPTYIREPDELFGAVDRSDSRIVLVESEVAVASDPAFDAFQAHHDPVRYATDAVSAYRAWSEPALMTGLDADRTPDERAAGADSLYDHTRARLQASPSECAWSIGLLRVRRQ